MLSSLWKWTDHVVHHNQMQCKHAPPWSAVQHSSAGFRKRMLVSDMAGESIMSTLAKHVQVFAADMGTAPLEQSAFVMKGTMVGTTNLHFTTLFAIDIELFWKLLFVNLETWLVIVVILMVTVPEYNCISLCFFSLRWWLLPVEQWSSKLYQGQLWVWVFVWEQLECHSGWKG